MDPRTGHITGENYTRTAKTIGENYTRIAKPTGAYYPRDPNSQVGDF